MFKHILVPVDDSPLATKAAKYAARVAKSSGARITALHVIPEFRPPAFTDGVIPYPELYSPTEYRKSTERYAAKLLSGRTTSCGCRRRCSAATCYGCFRRSAARTTS